MRKFKVIIPVLICILLIGCVSDDERDTILRQLADNDIIDSSWTLTDKWTESAAPVPGISAYMYEYYDSSADIRYCVRVPAYWSMDNNEDKYMNVSIYTDATVEVKEYDQYNRRTDSYITYTEHIVSDYSDVLTYTFDKTNVFGLLERLRLEAID